VHDEFVLSPARLFEGAEKASVRFVKWRSVDVAGGEGSLDERVVCRVADCDSKIARVQTDLLVADDPIQVDVSARKCGRRDSTGVALLP
jgi:hypothetical protein